MIQSENNSFKLFECFIPLFLKIYIDKDPKRRLYFDRIQNHEFFKTIDWEALERKEITPPFTPLVSNETDTRNFEIEFTGESVELTPPDQGLNHLLLSCKNRVSSFNRFLKGTFPLRNLSNKTLDPSRKYSNKTPSNVKFSLHVLTEFCFQWSK